VNLLPEFSLLLPMLLLALLAGVIRGFTGFGAGLVLIPTLGLLLGPQVAVPVVVLMEVIVILQLVPPALKLVQWRTILPVVIPAALAIPLGSMALASADPAWIQRGISVVVLVFVGLLATGWRYGKRPSVALSFLVGSASGLLTGSAGIGGPPVILFFLTGKQQAPRLRAGFLCYFAITQIVAMTAFGMNGLLDRRVLWNGAALLPLFIIGAWAGTKLFGRVNETTFRRLVMAFLALAALTGLFLGGMPG
jgi:uncharacterized membrane protein YfcA